MSTSPRGPGNVVAANRRFYDALWSGARLQRPERFNTWPTVAAFLPGAAERLELGPGLRPRLPIAGTHFIDISEPVVQRLNAQGGLAVPANIGALPFDDAAFDLVCAFDVVEHLEDDERVIAEMSRVLRDGAPLVLAVPAHADRWTWFDDWVGHARRYEPALLMALLARYGLRLERSAAYGMLPSPWVLEFGRWWLERNRGFAMWWYNWFAMPLALVSQKPLSFEQGLIDTDGVGEMVLVCRRESRPR
jgi:SAM-dependent methyltransferase